jgi:hypothetical protein
VVTGRHHKGEKLPPARICEREGVVAAIWRRDVVIEPVLASGNKDVYQSYTKFELKWAYFGEDI